MSRDWLCAQGLRNSSCSSGQLPGRKGLLMIPSGGGGPHRASGPEKDGRRDHGSLSLTPLAAWVQKTQGDPEPRRRALEHAYLTYGPFQIDFNEGLSVPHFLQLKQFPSGILLKLLFNLK